MSVAFSAAALWLHYNFPIVTDVEFRACAFSVGQKHNNDVYNLSYLKDLIETISSFAPRKQ
jgi:hypothetical protein